MAYTKYMTDLIKRMYRVTKSHDAQVKKISRKKKISESQVIRDAIELTHTQLLDELLRK